MKRTTVSTIIATTIIVLGVLVSPAYAGSTGPNATAPQPPNGRTTIFDDNLSNNIVPISRYGSNPFVGDQYLTPGQGYASTFSWGIYSGTWVCVEQFTGNGWVGVPALSGNGPKAVVPAPYTTYSLRVRNGSGSAFNCEHWG